MLKCAFCGQDLAYVHGHATCIRSGCPMFGVNQAECCSGEVAVVPTSAVARVAPAPKPEESLERTRRS
jgi:hypothetical protein